MSSASSGGWLKLVCLATAVLVICPGSAWAQRKKNDKDKEATPPAVEMVTYANPRVIEANIGLQVTTGNGQLGEVIGTTAFPADWPEQTVEILETNVPRGVRQSLRDLPGGSRQLVMMAPQIPAQTNVEVIVKVRITKSHIVGPTDPSTLVIPKPIKMPRELKLYMGNSPNIDATSGQIRRIARELADKKPENAWEHVKLIYDWTRENIKYTRGDIKDTLKTLKDKEGDCEDMSGVFIAICRASGVPARVVWIPGHSYPEFYLEDADGHGFWFPCQVAGSESFGSMADHLPILQKGDRFKVPEKTESQRYLVDFFTSKKIVGEQKPKIAFVRQLLGDAANLKVADELVVAKDPANAAATDGSKAADSSDNDAAGDNAQEDKAGMDDEADDKSLPADDDRDQR